MRITTIVVNALGVCLFVALSLYLWCNFYLVGDLATLLLFPLSVFVFLGSLRSGSAVYLATMKTAVREESSLAWLMTGRLRAFLGAAIFVLVTIPLLAWYAISSTYVEFILIIILCFISSILYTGTNSKLLKHLTVPFARAFALTASTMVASLLFIPVLVWANWSFTPQPGNLRSVNLLQALQIGFDQLPVQRGLVAEIMAPLFALEYAKLWFVVHAESPRWFSFLYSIDAALISIIVARSSAVLMSIVHCERRP